MKQKQCVVCQSFASQHVLVIAKNGYNIKRCNNCGFLFVFNSPSERFLNSFYKNFDYKTDLDLEFRIREDAKRSLQVIDKLSVPLGKLFDIGCGRGYFLDEARSLGWNTFGIDYSHEVIDYAVKVLRLNVKVGNILSYSTKKRFSLITLNQVLEHILSPGELIRKCYELLNTNGYVYIATPNIESISARIFGAEFEHIIPPEHLNFFSNKTLEMLLRDNGFKLIYHGSWSYPENLAGIIKKFVKNRKGYKLSTSSNQPIEFNQNNSIGKKIKYIVFDQLFCQFFYKLLEIDSFGINLEVIAQK